jgi:drug/metabolite transporter (DMT)-like permease
MSPLEVSFWRAAFSGSLYVLHGFSTQQLRLYRPHDLILFIFFGLLAASLFNASYFLAVQHGRVPLATFTLYTTPAFVAIVAHFLFSEKLSAYKISLICLRLALALFLRRCILQGATRSG